MNSLDAVDTATRPLPVEILVLIFVIALLVIGVSTFAMSAFIRAGKKDSEQRRRLGLQAKDPLDPKLPSQQD